MVQARPNSKSKESKSSVGGTKAEPESKGAKEKIAASGNSGRYNMSSADHEGVLATPGLQEPEHGNSVGGIQFMGAPVLYVWPPQHLHLTRFAEHLGKVVERVIVIVDGEDDGISAAVAVNHDGEGKL